MSYKFTKQDTNKHFWHAEKIDNKKYFKKNRKDVENDVQRGYKEIAVAKNEGNDDLMPVYSPIRPLPVIPPKKVKKVKKTKDAEKLEKGPKGFEKKRKTSNELSETEREKVRMRYATGKYTQAELADFFDVCSTTIYNIVHSKNPKKQRGGASFKHIKIKKPIAKYMHEKVIKHPGITANILKGKILHRFKVRVGKSAINDKLLHNMAKDGYENFTFKKLYVYHTERNSPKIKRQGIRYCKLYDAYLTRGFNFLYLDESPCELVIYQKKGRFFCVLSV
jgi:DNA-binding XRE family transcriptional regulator